MNRPSPDDMKQIMMAEKRVKNKKLKENIILIIFMIIMVIFTCYLYNLRFN